MATKPAKTEFGWIDGSGEHSRTQLYVQYDDQADTAADIATTANTVRVALEALTLLNETSVKALIPVHSAAPTLPTSPWAQREHGLRMTYSDTVTGKVYRSDIPGVDQTPLRQANTDVPITTALITALIAAVQTNCVSELGNPITVVGFRLYGKNN